MNTKSKLNLLSSIQDLKKVSPDQLERVLGGYSSSPLASSCTTGSSNYCDDTARCNCTPPLADSQGQLAINVDPIAINVDPIQIP